MSIDADRITSLVREVRLALRRLSRDAGLFVTTVTTMAIGIGVVASVFALVEGVLLRPLPYPDPDRLVSVRHVAPGFELTRSGVSAGVFLHYRDRSRVFEGLAAYEVASHTFADGGASERVQHALVTPELFSVLRVVPQLGRLPAASDWNLDSTGGSGTTGALLSHELWVRRYAADPAVIGRTMALDGRPFAVVIGVAPQGFSFPDPQTQMWLVAPQERVAWSGRALVREGMFLRAVGRLRPGVTIEQAEQDLNRLVRSLPEAYADITAEEIRDLGLRAQLRPFKDEVVGEVRLTLLLILASSGFLLLVTWANVANLLLLRTHARQLEIGLMRAIGASERNIALRLLSESLVLTTSGGLLGLALAYVATGTRFGFAPHQLPRLDQVEVNGAVIGLVAALAAGSGLLMAAVCLASTRQRVAGPALSALRSRSATQGREGQTGRRILVAMQMAMALTLLVGSGLMARTFWRLQQVDLGFVRDDRLTFYLPVTHLGLDADHHEFAALHERVLRRLRRLPGVDAVEAASTAVFPLTLPESGDDPAAVAPPGAARSRRGEWPLAYYGYATPGYFQAMGISLIAGRLFGRQDTSPSAPGVIISQSLARDLFQGDDPIGRSLEFVDFRSFWVSHVIVGVVGDVPGTTMRQGPSRAVYLPHVFPPADDASRETLHPYMPRYETYVVRTERELVSLIPELRRAVAEVDPRLPMLDIASLEAIVNAATAQERITLRLLGVSAGAALLLGVVGIYGVLAYLVRRRTAEIAIRLALGASPRRVTGLVVSQGMALSAAGIAAGIAAAYLLTRFIASLLYETSPTDPATFIGMAVLLFGVAVAASYVPARRASRIDPANALRGE